MQTFKEFLRENTNEKMDFREVMIIYVEGLGGERKGKFKPDEKFDREQRDFAEELYKAEPILSDMCYYELDREEIQIKPGMSRDEWERKEIIRLYSPSSDPVHTFLVGLIKALYFDTLTIPDFKNAPADIESYLIKRFPRFKRKMERFWMNYHASKYYKDRSTHDFYKELKECFEDAFWLNINIFDPFEENKENMPISWGLRSLSGFLGVN